MEEASSPNKPSAGGGEKRKDDDETTIGGGGGDGEEGRKKRKITDDKEEEKEKEDKEEEEMDEMDEEMQEEFLQAIKEASESSNNSTRIELKSDFFQYSWSFVFKNKEIETKLKQFTHLIFGEGELQDGIVSPDVGKLFENLESICIGQVNLGDDIPTILPSTVKYWTKLKVLEVYDVTLPLPPEIGYWKNLEKIYGEVSLVDFPDHLVDDSATTTTTVTLPEFHTFEIGLGSAHKSFPSWIFQKSICPKFRTLRFAEVERMQSWPEHDDDPDGEEDFWELDTLSLHDVPRLTNLPSKLKVKQLKLSKVPLVTTIPNDLMVTEYVDFRFPTSIQSLPSNLQGIEIRNSGTPIQNLKEHFQTLEWEE